MESKNLILNPRFTGNASQPEGWRFVTPRPELAPRHELRGNEERSLVLGSTGDRYAIGGWEGEARLEVGQWYHASIRLKLRDIDNPQLSIFARMAEHLLLPKTPWADEMVLEQTFLHAKESDGGKIQLYLRAAEQGEVEWFEPQVISVDAPEHRIARVATTRFGHDGVERTLSEQRFRIMRLIDEAGLLKPDIVCVTEASPILGVPQSEFKSWADVAEHIPTGPMCSMLAEKARQCGMYVLCGIIERDGRYVFNTTVIFGRDGEYVGRYRKTHLTFWEYNEGVSPGDDYPVFALDFGRIAVHICYDEWFPEVSRLYAHKGAEILFLPVMGGKPITWRTRALDNGIYFVSSSYNPPSMIIDSSGEIIAETHRDGVACANLNLDQRLTNYYGDPTLAYGMPCIVPQMRHVVDDRLLEELNSLMREAK